MDIQELLKETINNNASDLHLLPELPPILRIDGRLIQYTRYPVLSVASVDTMIFALLRPDQKELLLTNREIDFSVGIGGGAFGDAGRFRVNAYYQKGHLAAAIRYLPSKIRSIEDLKLPTILHSFSSLKQGLVLVTGPTGHGKSTTLASIINEINMTVPAHILTIEDPIEYIYPQGMSVISQREMLTDTHSWNMALRSSLREDPDVVLVGEMRDPETIASAITLAETGHLVFSTLHTNSAAQSIDRMIDSFPSHQQPQIRTQLSFTLKGIISQRLLPQISGGRIPAVEVMTGSSAIASNIRDGKTHLIDSIIQTSQDSGMIPLEASLAQLVTQGIISLDTAKQHAIRVEELLRMVG